MYTIVTVNEDLVPSFNQPDFTSATMAQKSDFRSANKSKKVSQVCLIANTHKTIIRIAKLTKHDRFLNPKSKWRFVQENFPLGMLLNETTHIFDGTIFANKEGKRCFLMAAFPKALSDAVAEKGIKNWGSIHKIQRLDTIEHMMFRHYSRIVSITRDANGRLIKSPLPQWVIFPQDEGYRVLALDEGLPQSTYRISNHPNLREAELQRAFDANAPAIIVILTFNNDDKADGLKPGISSWIEVFARSRGNIEVKYEPFTLTK